MRAALPMLLLVGACTDGSGPDDLPDDTELPGDTDVVEVARGLDERPANPACVAFQRPPSGAPVDVRLVPTPWDGHVIYPVDLVQHPTDPEVFYGVEKGVPWRPDEIGRIRRIDGNTSPPTFTNFVHFPSGKVLIGNEAGLLSMAFHPDFTSNGYVYLSYIGPGDPLVHYVSRFVTHDGGTTLDPASEKVLLEIAYSTPYDHAGHIRFGPDGLLYVSTGFGGSWAETTSQDPYDLRGKLLRIDVDAGDPYAIPPANPWPDGQGGAPEVYALGFRNPWRYSFDRATGDLWLGDVGIDTWEEIDRVHWKGNYGFGVLEGFDCVVAGCDPSGFEDPEVVHLHADQGGDAQAVIGGFVYRGEDIPALRGTYIYGDVNGTIWALTTDQDGNAVPQALLTGLQSIFAFAEDHRGEIYVLTPRIYSLAAASSPVSVALPEKLSETGCMDPEDPSRPGPGLVPYDVNAPLWSDGAEKERWMALPDGTTIEVREDGDWEFPVGTILVKQFRLGDRLVETRLFMRHEDGNWAGYTYAWNEEQTDAELLYGGKTVVVGEQLWQIPSRAECLSCHTGPRRVLGPRTGQLNRAIRYPSTGRLANQLTTLEHVGMLDGPLPAPPEELDRWADPADDAAPAAHRARAYLASNCSHCHFPGSAVSPAEIDLTWQASVEAMALCDEPPLLGDLGIEDARIVAPGDPERSVLLARMNDQAFERMPPLGTDLVDPTGTQAVFEWITSMQTDCR